MAKNTAKVRRGLRWVIDTASADFEVVRSDADGGRSHFRPRGCTRSDVEAALAWLEHIVSKRAAVTVTESPDD